jgi:hypothetical protein
VPGGNRPWSIASEVDSHPEDDETWLPGFPLGGSEPLNRVASSAIRVSSSCGVTLLAPAPLWGQISNFNEGARPVSGSDLEFQDG